MQRQRPGVVGPSTAARSPIPGPRDSLPVPGSSNSNASLPNPRASPQQAPSRSTGGGASNFQNAFNTSGKGGGAFRPISENFSVNAVTGTLALAIPIRVSQTRGGFGPDLKLAYDSGKGNGPFGFGWDITMPSLQRKTNHAIPSYIDEKDSFALSGNDIVPALKGEAFEVISNAEFEIARYLLATDPTSARVEKWTRRSDRSDVHWRTISAGNATTIYGDSDASRVLDTSLGRKRIFTWLISRSYDANGNAIEYSYKREDRTGLANSSAVLPVWEQNRTDDVCRRQIYLKRIRYGNRAPCRHPDQWEQLVWPTQWMFETVFDYGDHEGENPSSEESTVWRLRKDAFSQCNAGFEIRTYRLCRRILMFHRFPERLQREENLTASTTFTYDESPRRSVLSATKTNGHSFLRKGEGGLPTYKTESLPPWTFEYTAVPNSGDIAASQANVTDLLKIPGRDDASSVFLDLEGDGVPGLLSWSADDTILYQRNFGVDGSEGDSPFRRPLTLDNQPHCAARENGRFEDLDGNGRIDYVCLDDHEVPLGFYERDDAGSWSSFSSFPQTPRGLPSSTSVAIDLTGNGQQDLLHPAEPFHKLTWQQSLGKGGWSEQRYTDWPSSSQVPSLSDTAAVHTFAADMTGDGLSDLVEISASAVAYWPNLGHGNFGSMVVMGNAPPLQQYGDFDFSRLTLVDFDGSGTTDLLYSLPTGGAIVFFNLAGNCWSPEVPIPQLWTPASSSLFVVDILGKGLPSICWTSPTTSALSRINYINPVGDNKPHLLCAYSNGLGITTTIEYSPSTSFSQRDEARGQRWTTKLPFPVHCVSSVQVEDKITGNSSTTTYSYHNGCYDPMKREFAGFEQVETFSHHSLVLGPAESYETPVKHTKSWYNVGLRLQVDESGFRTPSRVASQLNDLLDNDHAQALRALKGKPVRVEIYGDDGSDLIYLPYEIQEFSYELHHHQSRSSNNQPAVSVTPRDTITIKHERNTADPRITHEMVLKTNRYGDIEESLKVVYPRGADFAKSTHYPEVEENQLAGNVTYLRTFHTNAIDGLNQPVFRKPAPWRHQDFEILRFSFPPSGDQLKIAEMQKYDFQALPQNEKTTTSKWLRSDDLTFYRNSSLTETLSAGLLEAYSVPQTTYSLALTANLMNGIKQSQERCKAPPLISIDLARQGGYVSTETIVDIHVKGGGGADFDRDIGQAGGLWMPSSVNHFNDGSLTAVDELQNARKSFYIPQVSTDAFGSRSSIKFDADFLLAESTTDALGNVDSLTNNYEHLQPLKVTDANLNTQQLAFDCLGRVIANAFLGKGRNEEDSDSLDLLQEEIHSIDVTQVLKDPLGDTTKRLLGNCNSRVVYCIGPENAQPFIMEITRDLSFRRAEEQKLRVRVTYLNGLGTVLQQSSLNDTEDGPNKWQLSDRSVTDFSGNVIRSFAPVFAPTSAFVPAEQITDEATTSFFDVVGRQIGTLFPDHTWSKSITTPWTTVEHSIGSMILSSPQTDSICGPYFKRLKSTRYLPTWFENSQANGGGNQAAAKNSTVYSETPGITHLGSCGLPIQHVRQVGDKIYSQAFKYDVNGNQVRQFDSLNRLCEKKLFDKLNRCLMTSGMDSGESWTVQDVTGNGIVTWNSRGTCFRNTYDALRRPLGKQMCKSSDQWQTVSTTTYGENVQDAALNNLKGHIWQIKDQAGIHTSVRYDIRGRAIEHSFAPTAEYKSVTDWAHDNPLEIVSFSSRSAYDNFDQEIFKEDAGGNRTQTTFSRLGAVQSITFWDAKTKQSSSHLASATYTPDQLPERLMFGNGVTTELQYDRHSRALLAQKTWRRTSSGARKFLEDITHVYDCESRLVRTVDASEQSKYFRNCKIDPVWEYVYDAIGQLVSARGRGQLPPNGRQVEAHSATKGSNPAQGVGDGSRLYVYEETYSYDLAGNLTFLRHSAPHDPSISGWTRTYSYAELSMLGTGPTNSDSDGDPPAYGNRLSSTAVGSVEEKFKYSGEAARMGCVSAFAHHSRLEWNMDNLLSASTTQQYKEGTPETTYYVYDNAGTRVRKITESSAAPGEAPRKMKETFYLGDVEIQLRFQSDGLEARTTKQIAKVSGPIMLVLIENTDNGTAALVRYQVGKNMEVDDSGQLISYEEYSPFGAVVHSAVYRDVEAPRKYRFAMYEQDQETGLYHCGMRYYAPWLGRWISPDPIGTADGDNLYRYVGNDPINYFDPTGTSKLEQGKRVINLLDSNKIKVQRQKQENVGNDPKGGGNKDSIKKSKKPTPESPDKSLDNTSGMLALDMSNAADTPPRVRNAKSKEETRLRVIDFYDKTPQSRLAELRQKGLSNVQVQRENALKPTEWITRQEAHHNSIRLRFLDQPVTQKSYPWAYRQHLQSREKNAQTLSTPERADLEILDSRLETLSERKADSPYALAEDVSWWKGFKSQFKNASPMKQAAYVAGAFSIFFISGASLGLQYYYRKT